MIQLEGLHYKTREPVKITVKNGYITDLLQEIIDRGIDVSPHVTKNEWLEIDTDDDYVVAKDLFLSKQFEF